MVSSIFAKGNKALRHYRAKREDTALTIGVICGEIEEKERAVNTLESVRKVISLCKAMYNSTGNADFHLKIN